MNRPIFVAPLRHSHCKRPTLRHVRQYGNVRLRPSTDRTLLMPSAGGLVTLAGVDDRPFWTYIHCISGGRMVTKIQKWGNSLALRIPTSFAAETNVVAGSTVDISVANGGLVVRPTKRRKYVLDELLKGVKPGNLHEEISTGERVGVEVW